MTGLRRTASLGVVALLLRFIAAANQKALRKQLFSVRQTDDFDALRCAFHAFVV
jgi:hypothetical protein